MPFPILIHHLSLILLPLSLPLSMIVTINPIFSISSKIRINFLGLITNNISYYLSKVTHVDLRNFSQRPTNIFEQVCKIRIFLLEQLLSRDRLSLYLLLYLRLIPNTPRLAYGPTFLLIPNKHLIRIPILAPQHFHTE